MTKVRYTLVGFLFVANTINYLDRANLSMAAPTLTHTFHLNAALMGLALSAFSWTYAASQLPAGALVDRFSTRVLYFGSLLWWGIASLCTAFVSSFAGLLGVRLALGVGEAPAMPISAKLTAEWLPVRERGRASAWFTAGVPFGTAVAPPLVGYLLTHFGWQSAFLASAVLSVAWSVVWVLWYRGPADNRRMSQGERDHIRQDRPDAAEAAEATPARWRDLFGHRNVWGLAIGYFALLYVLFMFMTWLPGYLVSARHMTTLKTGFDASIPWICGTLACLAGGMLSDRLVRSGHRPLRARRSLLTTGLVIATAVIPAAYVTSTGVAVALLAVSVSGIMFANGVAWAACEDAAPAGKTGSVASLVNFSGNIGGLLAPIITGWLVYATGSFVAPLVLGGVLALIGAGVYATMLRDSDHAPAAHEPSLSASR